MRKTPEPHTIYDSSALEAANEDNIINYSMGVLENEQAFLSVCESIAKLYGHRRTRWTSDELATNRCYSFYYTLVTILLHESRYTIYELDRELARVAVVHEKQKRPHPLAHIDDPINYLLSWIRYSAEEPKWHRDKRGDNRSLCTTKGKNLWGWLNKLYTDPEQARMKMPDDIRKAGKLYKGFDECVRSGVYQGQEELRRIHGIDVDLTPLVDRRKDDNPHASSFISALRSGEMGRKLGKKDESLQ